mgnify:CR=1 FL=1
MVTKDKIIRKGENDMLSFESDYTEGAHEAILKTSGGDKPGADSGVWS